MQAKDVVTHAIVISVMGQGIEVQVTRALTQGTSGHYDSISAANGLPDKLRALAQQIVSDYNHMPDQYVMEYASDSKDPRADLKVTMTRQGLAVTMSRGMRLRQ